MSYQQAMRVVDEGMGHCGCDDGGCEKEWCDKIAQRFHADPQYLIPVLQFIQSDAGYLAPKAMKAASKYLRISESKIYGVASFYAQFHFEPRGKHTVTVCRGTACHVGGSGRLVEELEKHLEVKAGGTTKDMLFTLETVACVGACALAPLVVVDNRAHGRQTSLSLKKTVDSIWKTEDPDSFASKRPVKEIENTKVEPSGSDRKPTAPKPTDAKPARKLTKKSVKSVKSAKVGSKTSKTSKPVKKIKEKKSVVRKPTKTIAKKPVKKVAKKPVKKPVKKTVKKPVKKAVKKSSSKLVRAKVKKTITKSPKAQKKSFKTKKNPAGRKK